MRSDLPSNPKRESGARAGLLRLLADGERGFTIIEVVVSAIIVASIAGAAATALIATTRMSADQRSRSLADQIAQQDQERLRGMSIKALSGFAETRTVGPYEGTTYTVRSTGKYISSTGTGSCSTSGTSAAAYVLVRSQVNWPANMKSGTSVGDVANWATNSIRPPVTQEALITPAAGGTLLVNVIDHNNAPLSGVTVTAFGPKETQSAVTDSDGCIVIGALSPTGYFVVPTKLGYVDKNGDPDPLGGATVSQTGTSFPSPNPFQLGQAGSITASFTTNGGTVTGQHAPSLSVSHAERTNPLITTPTSPTGPITTLTELYPFTTGYTVWAGSCPGMQPPAGPDRVTAVVAPGVVGNPATVKEPGMNLRVWYPSNTTGNRRKPSQVKLTYTETAGGTCSQSWLPALRTDSDTNSAGALVSRGQPFAGTTTVGSTTYTGSYKICAVYDPDGAGGNNPRYQELTSQTLTNFGAATTKNVVITDSSPFTATSAGNCP